MTRRTVLLLMRLGMDYEASINFCEREARAWLDEALEIERGQNG